MTPSPRSISLSTSTAARARAAADGASMPQERGMGAPLPHRFRRPPKHTGHMAVVGSPAAPLKEDPMSHGSFAWNELRTNDIEGAKAFYGKTIGWTFEEMA